MSPISSLPANSPEAPSSEVSASQGLPYKSLPYRSWVEVSRPQIAANFHAIQNLVGPGVEVMPVVKADAYRHGAVEVSRTLQAEGARWLAVSNTDEGVALRDAGIAARILVMADFLPFTREAAIAHNLTPVIHSLTDIAEFDRLAAARAQHCHYHLKIDTGLGRLGVRSSPASIAEAILAAKHVKLEGLMTHFASAANYQSPQTDDQLRRFDQVIEALATAGIHPPLIHLSSTNPIAYARRQAWRSMIRPGHSIYGYVSPARGHANPSALDVKPALTWRATVLSVKEIPAGCLIGYGGMFRTARPTRVAVLAAGYADGIPHRLGNRGSVIVNGKLSPIIGAVSMDLTTVDVTESPQTQVGDAVTLLGSEGDLTVDAQQIAKWAGTISYSVLCGIHARVRRLYV
jgi:alanine racemase